MSDDNEDAVGYGKPPRHGRFRKGRSGNPKGRKKGNRNFATDLAEVLATTMSVTENGRKTKVSTQKAALLRLREKALLGNAQALERLLSLARQHSDEKAAQSADGTLRREEEAILMRYEADLLAWAKAGGQVPEPGEEDDAG